MGNNLYDTGAPRRVVVVNPTAPATEVVRQAQAASADVMDALLRNLVDYLARNAEGREQRREATREREGPIIDAEYEVIEVAPPRRQLAAPKPTRRK